METIFPTLSRKVAVPMQQQRLELDDGDFLDLYWKIKGNENLVILCHGLEGDAERMYMQGMVRALQDDFDCLSFNYRGCGTEMNRLRRFYHSGATDDLQRVVEAAQARGYDHLFLVGFSLGGNLTLRYLGEQGKDSGIKAAVAISTPLDLYGCTIELHKRHNKIYHDRFLKSLKEKVRRKAKLREGDFDLQALGRLKTLWDFDDQFTAPIAGFEGAKDYYTKCSSGAVLDHIQVPTMILNAKNDPFLSDTCYAEHYQLSHDNIQFLQPDFGGHVGFFQFGGRYYSEMVTHSFLVDQR
ncbi:YheT family hydrolase [Persicobacter psychrovividus]|uniref:Alpha/beta hydrolase n=1 Tax=Persicobacter psychrovividus TaxID=387638 RepID=A0ABN6L7U8_9BACT|nr:alpha/beta hydrolase [Persicobacter psychrovividus]